MTVDEFCGQIGISRQKFYRFVKEPRRFSSDTIRSIIDVLSLSPSETRILESHLYPNTSAESVSDSADYTKVIRTIFSRRLSEELSMIADHIEYTGSDGIVTMESSESLARLIAEEFSDMRGPDSDARMSHDFKFTIYNCLPTCDDITQKRVRRTDQWIMTIAQIIKGLDDTLLPTSDIKTRVRHYISNRERHKLLQAEKGDKSGLVLGLHIFNTILPLMSLAEDYKLDRTLNLRRFWFDNRDVCVIRHSCRLTYDSLDGQERGDHENSRTSYYLLIFSDNGDCYACRLGSEEASHIYRFFSIDSDALNAKIKEMPHPTSPNQIFYQMDSQYKMVQIHPDLSFGDVPPQLWMSLYKEVEGRDDEGLYERIFRKMIDPYNQYAFLSFKDLVYSAIGTLQQRTQDANRFGKVAICHPEGLQNLVRTGMVLDLLSDSIDYTGTSWSSSPLRFPPSMIRRLLKMIRDNIALRLASGSADPIRPGETNFFIMHPHFQYPEISMVIYDGLGISPIYGRGVHKHTTINLFQSPAIGTLIYNYVVDEMLRKRDKNFKSAILSDEHSIILLDNLIAQLDRQSDHSGQGDRL